MSTAAERKDHREAGLRASDFPMPPIPLMHAGAEWHESYARWFYAFVRARRVTRAVPVPVPAPAGVAEGGGPDLFVDAGFICERLAGGGLSVPVFELNRVTGDEASYSAAERKIAAALSAAPPAPEAVGWRPIETAPKDGTLIVATGLNWGVGPDRHYAIVSWGQGPGTSVNECWREVSEWSDESGLHYLDGWMPLPAPPAAPAPEAEGAE